MKYLFLLLLCNIAYAETGAVRVSCNPPSQREDGTAFGVSDSNFYLIYVTKPDKTVKEFRLDRCELDLLLDYGDYSHQAIVCDKDLNCSAKSSVRKFTVKTPPKKPTYPSARAI